MNNLKFSICDITGLNPRIEVVLKEIFQALSRRYFAGLLDQGVVNLNSKKIKRGTLVKIGDEVEFPSYAIEFQLGSKRIDLEDRILNVVYEDPEFIVINKPRAMHSILLKQTDPITLADLIYEKYPETLDAGRQPNESGLVQRLDYYTSGLIIAARNRDTWERLHDKFTRGAVLKEYLALLDGVLPKNKEVGLQPYGIRIIERSEDKMLISFSTSEGTRHVVRKKCAELGFPLTGDQEYGAKTNRYIINVNGRLVEAEGFFLCAASIRFQVNARGAEVNFKLPADLTNLKI